MQGIFLIFVWLLGEGCAGENSVWAGIGGSVAERDCNVREGWRMRIGDLRSRGGFYEEEKGRRVRTTSTNEEIWLQARDAP